MTRRPAHLGPWPVGIILAAVVTAILVFSGVGAGARPYVVLGFALVCPGMALVRLLGIGDPLLEVAVAIALSIGVEVLASLAMIFAGLWSPKALFAGLVAFVIVGAGLELGGARIRAEQQP
jgi:hypothetical protein